MDFPPGYCKYCLLKSNMAFYAVVASPFIICPPSRTSDEARPHPIAFRIFLVFFVELVMKDHTCG